jgi:hypothetical protein
LCSHTPGSSLAAACCSDSCSHMPGTSLAATCCSDWCSCTPGSSLAMARLTVLADCSCLAHLAPLLLLLVILTHVLAQLGLCVHCVFAQSRMIALNSSLQDWHAFALDKEPWFDSLLVYNWNEDSFRSASNPSPTKENSDRHYPNHMHSLVCVCIASLHSVGWLLQTPHYRIGTPLRLIKSLGLILCQCTIGMRIHLGVPVTPPQPRKIRIDIILIIVWLDARRTGHDVILCK